jgi:hypothetical protein
MRKEITEAQITELMRAIPRAEEVDRLRAEIKRLREALKPFAALSLWPDDIGDEWTVNDIRSGYDWDETENDTKTDDVFIKRGHIRAARKALEGKP